MERNFSSTKLHNLTWEISKSIGIKGCSSGDNILEIDLSLEDLFTLHRSGSLDIQTVSLDTVRITQIETISLKTITVFFLFPLLLISLHYSFSGLSFPELFLSLAIPPFYFVSFSQTVKQSTMSQNFMFSLSVPRKSLQML